MTRFRLLLLAGCLCLLAASNVAAQSDIGFKGVGLEVGFVNPEEIDAAFGIGAFADLGTIAPGIALEAYLDYWSKSMDEFGVEASVRDIALGAKAKYYFDVSSTRIHPFAGGGLGIHFVNTEVTIPDQNIGGFIVPGMSESESSTKLGLDIGGGFHTPISPNMNFLTEMWIGLVSGVNQLSFKFGVVYNL